MQKYFAAATVILMFALVATRVSMLRRRGIEAMNFGKIDRTDFLIPPFALFYFYLIFANAFRLPTVSRQVMFDLPAVAWFGVLLCGLGLALLGWSLVSFGQSFRVGIDLETTDRLVTTGAFGLTRNPIYVAFSIILLGQFLVFPNWILLLYTCAGEWLFHRQILREEEFLKKHYREEFLEYCRRVKRYL
jgi:protein-S-isoprenylcysteine O-methyltransferase Ste14